MEYRLFFRGRRMDIMRSEWPIDRFFSLETMEVLTMKPTPERRLSVVGFPDQKRVYPALCSWRLCSPMKRTWLRAAMSTFNLTVYMQSELSDVQVAFCELRQVWFWRSSMRLSVFLYPLRWVRTFFVLMFLDRLRRFPLTTASQQGD